MTHLRTNGASLEDCHTNFFALTELCGIKWRKMTWGGGGTYTSPLDDPVLSSYSRCLAGDVLCVWRRVARPSHDNNDPSVTGDHLQPPPPPPPAQPPPLSLTAAKELWIFWYGEEPDLGGLVSQELFASEGEHGSWESGLSYECRSLLFKALHNLIERCLLSRDFVRLGKWFVQPYDEEEEDVVKSCWHLSFSFAFFVHGENTVCASVDVRQHPPVRKFTKLPTDAHNTKVILAPFGLAGTVISPNNNNNTSEPNATHISDPWSHFYPIDDDSAIDVVIGGSRMRYPTKYVLLTEMDEVPFSPAMEQIYEHLSAVTLAHRSLTELCLAQHEPELIGGADASVDIKPGREWDFVDPTRKTSCSCPKCRRTGTKRNSAGERINRRAAPFHRRRAPRHSSTCFSIGGSQGTPGGGSPGSCGGGSPIGSGDVGTGGIPPSPTLIPPNSVTNPVGTPNMTAPATPRAVSSVPPPTPSQILLPHTPAPTPPPIAPPHTPMTPRINQTSGDATTESLKRPILCLQEVEFDPTEEERPLDLLYDYSNLYAWLNHPVKKFKTDENIPMDVDVEAGWDDSSHRKGEDLYAGHNHTKMAPVDPQPCNGPHPYIKSEIKQEPNQDDTKENKNLFTSDGLQASYKDLEQIFDNSDDTSGDETLQVHTPPDSNKSGGGCLSEDGGMGGTVGGITILSNSGGRTGSRAPCAVRPEELSKMFPTPPSLEPNPLPSPGAYTQSDDHQVVPNIRCGSPPEELIDDWSYVFKPPTICKYVGSSKYAALPGLMNSPTPTNCIYRPSWQQQSTPSETRTAPRPPPPRTPHHMPNLHSVGTISQPASVGCVSGVGSAPPPPLAATPSPASSVPPSGPISSLLLNLLLADTALNIFRDHNFDSCTMCVCNAGPKVVGNIRGADSGVYLSGGVPSPASPDSPSSPMPNQSNGIGSGLLEEDPIRCSCGFSAVVNRRLAHRAGLFYEDEMEITGLAEDPAEYKKHDGAFSEQNKIAASNLVELVREHCSIFNSSASALHVAASEEADKSPVEPRLHLLEYADSGEAAALALEATAGRAAHAIHKWPFLRAPAPSCGRDVVRVMRRLQPLLQEAIQKKCSTRMWDAVAGPLTWRQFHRLAGRGTDDLCEPQPIPPLLFGHDRDWVSLSPYAVHYWDKLLLEPYSYSRDIGYIVLVPDSSALIPKVRSFFRDLSTAYEQCRLGRHVPVNRISKDGLYRIPRPQHVDNPDEWFASLPEGTTSEILKTYVQTCRGTLAQALSNLQIDKTLLDGDSNSNSSSKSSLPERSAPSPMAPPSTPDHPSTPTAATQNEQETDASNNSNSLSTPSSNTNSVPETSTNIDDEEGNAPCIVVYIVEPATGGDKRTSCLAMLRAASTLLNSLPENIRSNVFTQLISCESISELGIGNNPNNGRMKKRSAQLRSLALSVFSQCRRQLTHTTNIKSLTGFGTAANADQFLKNKDEKNRMPYRLYAPPYVLAPPRPLKDTAETFGQAPSEPCSVLYLSYCLSADQSWLLAVATDGRGELLESCTINVDVPGRSRRRRAPPARRLGLTKLMDFTLGVMSQSVQPWRLVVGRIGRIGHGELKGWSWLLSRKNLLKASTALRDVCTSCSLMYPGGAPCILSACLVSTEPDASLRLMADQFTPDERFSQVAVASQLSTPQDVTCTHILVFPTSATTQSSQTAFQEQHINDPELGDDMDLFPVLNDDMPDENEFNDIFNGWASGMQSPGTSPKREDDGTSRPGSPGRPAASHGRHSPLSDDGNARCGEEVGTLLQQPLALGYLVSTAPLGRMPKWWWSACPHAAQACPAFLKNALHLHSPAVQQNSDDLLQQPPPSLPQHPLDSHYTTDVLRYVLEGYNALSWLSLDCNTHDRLSCLPAHVQVLMQLYHLTAALV